MTTTQDTADATGTPAEAAQRIPTASTTLEAERMAEFTSSDLAGQVQFLAARLRSIGHSHANRVLQEELGLKVRQYSVLALAAADVSPSQRELGDFLSLDPSQIVNLVDFLEKRGWVERQVDPRDRRSRIVVATPQGRDAYLRAHALTEASDDVVLAALSADERRELTRLLEKVAF
jgi:DNA-binding MarR family transcriptional regulator